ncbi:hypothetical protein CONCODRAFT_8701 [Conidiobolus coronatus NRRL 28638]|uniref:SH3 domain-containing protein n=1 Tax=Conidiobolus coronatus (strain ATCC 28846 / CBS 209.66 / NRRL 28638) TaxID=796925 RepID=A0A137P1L9_CONC2|nr:hypothetical protein CONCODRAFT_8701 [Conidiobolus coronatus NRRL 28638]|eukprot:KXN68950.1 hypothetical protein CONCODRAFT_8701 [Conidiobolus coronatus NRRL 28638]
MSNQSSDFIAYLKENIQRDLKQLNKLKGVTNQDLDTILSIINKSSTNNNNSYISESTPSSNSVSSGFKKPSIPPKVGGTIGTIELTKKDLDENKNKFGYSVNKPKPNVENGASRFAQDIKNTADVARSFNNQDSNIDEDRPIASVRSAAAMFGAKTVAGGPPPPVASKPSGFNKANLTKSVSAATGQNFRMPMPTSNYKEEEVEESSPTLPSRANSIASSRAYPAPSTPERSPMPEPVSRAPAPEPAVRAPPALPRTKKPEPYLIEVVAEYDFSGEDESELSFSEGQTVFVTEYIDDQWWKGRCEGKTGMFPSSYVKEV